MPIKTGTVTTRGLATRRRIISSAAELMFANGVADTRIEEVRASAGVSNSQIYQHFADKTALVRAVIDFQTDAVIEPQERLFGRLDTMDGLRTWRDRAVHQQRGRNLRGGCPIGSLAGQLADGDEAFRLQLAHSFERWSAGLQTGLKSMHTNGTLRPDADPEELATVLLAALQGGLLLAKLSSDIRPLELSLDAALAHVESQLAA
ncbi:MAG TPA: TetR/AcrR family transcriptional regulator [Galbitalea sp.]|jgi:AcrR family transcriptional regulator|nr:TetR/AcrR family transcriptional regulator [Galbitalea sp.]